MTGDTDGEHPALGAALAEAERLRREAVRLAQALMIERAALRALKTSFSWRLTAPLRETARAIKRLGWILTRPRAAKAGWLAPFDRDAVARWVALEDRTDAIRRPILARALAAIETPCTLSLLLPVGDDPEDLIAATIDSVFAQTAAGWQLCLVDNGSTQPHVARALGSYGHDGRVSVRRRSAPDPTAGLVEALDMATGDLVAVMAPGDVLAATAVAEIVLGFARHGDWQAAYGDEDRLTTQRQRVEPRFKSGWSPDLLLASPYLGRPCVLRRSLVLAAGGFRAGFAGAEDYDLALRALVDLPAGCVGHIPRVLCHRPQGAPPSESVCEAGRRAAQERVSAWDPQAIVEPLPIAAQGHRIRWSRRPQSVSVVVATRDRADLLARCITDVLAEAEPGLELIVVDNDSREPRTLALLAEVAQDQRVTVLEQPGPFNWSVLNNAGAAVARGEVLVLLNNDIETIEAGWLAELTTQAMRPAIGVVGAKLLYVDGRLQHGGIWLGPALAARHLLRLSADQDPGYLGQLALPHNLSAVTGACLALRRELFVAVGGLDPTLRIAFNDLDLCLRVGAQGYRTLWTPHACLRHLESATRGRSDTKDASEIDAEHRLFRQRWGERLNRDPFFNPNLDLIGEDTLAITHPPRWDGYATDIAAPPTREGPRLAARPFLSSP